MNFTSTPIKIATVNLATATASVIIKTRSALQTAIVATGAAVPTAYTTKINRNIVYSGYKNGTGIFDIYVYAPAYTGISFIENNTGKFTKIYTTWLTVATTAITGSNYVTDGYIASLPELGAETYSFNNNQLDSTTQDLLILGVWSNAISALRTGKTFNILSNDGTYSAQSAAYLTALNDNATFKWTINTVAPSGTGFTNIDSVEDLQTLAVNKTVAAVQTKDFDASVTHTWGINKPVYQLVIPTTITTGTVATVVNGNITFGATTYQVCGVYFDNTQTLKGFYVNSTTELTGDIAQSTTFASATYTCTPILHYYADLTTTYATEKAKFGIINDVAYNLTEVAAQRVVGYNDELKRVYYMGQTIGDNTQAKTGFVPIGTVAAPFTGSYNCQGYKITNLYVNSNARGVGAFGAITGNTSSSIRLKDDIIIGFGHTGIDSIRVGAIGSVEQNRTLTNSYATGSVFATGHTNVQTGGLVGFVTLTSSISNSYSAGKVAAIGNVSVYTGGLVGHQFSSCSVANSYSTSAVYGMGHSTVYTGGLLGRVITNCRVYNSFGYGTILGVQNGTTLAIKAIYEKDATSSSFNVYQLGETVGRNAAFFKNKANFATVTANYAGIAGVTTHSATTAYKQYTIVKNAIPAYYMATQDTTGTSLPLDPVVTTYWQLLSATPKQVGSFWYKIVGDYTISASTTETGTYVDITVHAKDWRAYANTGRVITADGKCYVALQNVPLTTAITDTAYWLEDTGFNFNTIWRMGNLYPELMAFYIATYNFFKQNFGSSNFIFKQRG